MAAGPNSTRSAPTRPRGRPAKNDRSTPFGRRDQIVAVALDLFAERNFAAVTIKDIAKAANVNAALLYYYFESKEDLFQGAIEFAVDQAFRNFRLLQARHDNPADVIDDWLINHVEQSAPIHKFVKISLDYSGSKSKMPVVDRLIRQFYDEELRILSGCIRQGIDDGLFAKVDPDSLAVFISTYLDGIMVRSVIQKKYDLSDAIGLLQREIRSNLKL
ncbi:MAG: TetR/AcrR family transcriptional regulator [Rhodospirillales bacterium]